MHRAIESCCLRIGKRKRKVADTIRSCVTRYRVSASTVHIATVSLQTKLIADNSAV